MTEAIATTETTVNTMNAAELHRILSDVKAFMSTDKTLPALSAVRIEARAGNLIAIATDRFTIGVSRADYSGEDFTANLSASNVDAIMRIAKTVKAQVSSRTVAIRIPSYVRDGEANTLSFSFITGESLTVCAEHTSFPEWRQLFPAEPIESGTEAHSMASFNPDFMARFAKVARDREGMRIFNRTGAMSPLNTKPAIVAIGDNFVGLIMQTREDRTRYANPSWLG